MPEYETFKKTREDGAEETWGRCPKHGEFLMSVYKDRVYYPIAYICPKCVKEKRDAELYGRAAIPKRFQTKTFSNYQAVEADQQKAFKAVEDFVISFSEEKDQGNGLVLFGFPGTGKTHLACAAASAVMRKGYSALFTNVRDLVSCVTDTWRERSSEREAIRLFTTPDLLIIDEIGGESGSDMEKRLLFSVLNRRYEDMMPTVLITNLSLKGLRDYLGDRAYSRLCETAKAIPFTWDSHRGNSVRRA